MSCEEEVISVRKQLERMSKEGGDQTQALDLLKALGKLPINLQVLTNTRCSFFWTFCYSIILMLLSVTILCSLNTIMKVLHFLAMRWLIKKNLLNVTSRIGMTVNALRKSSNDDEVTMDKVLGIV